MNETKSETKSETTLIQDPESQPQEISQEDFEEAERKRKVEAMVKAHDLTGISSLDDLKARMIRYVCWHQENRGMCKLASLNRRFNRAAKGLGVSPKFIVDVTAVSGELTLEQPPGKNAFVVYPTEFRTFFRKAHAERGTSPYEVTEIWNTILNNAI